jgi:hypothetical protein
MLLRCGLHKGLEFVAGIGDCDESRIIIQRHLEAACVVDLRYQAGIGE